MSIVSAWNINDSAEDVFRYLGIKFFCRGWPAILFDSLCYQVNHSLVEITAHDTQAIIAGAKGSKQVSSNNACSASVIKDYCISWRVRSQATAGKQSLRRRTGSCLGRILGYWMA